MLAPTIAADPAFFEVLQPWTAGISGKKIALGHRDQMDENDAIDEHHSGLSKSPGATKAKPAENKQFPFRSNQMLVLSRRESEQILFPSLGISIEVVKIQGRRARLGINAPADVPVLRHECAVKKVATNGEAFGEKGIDFTSDLFQTNQKLCRLMEIMRARLSSASTSLNKLSQSVDEDNEHTSQQFMSDLFNELRSLESEANGVLEASGVLVNSPTQALIVEDGASERKLLEGFLEISGFEVIVAKDGQDALDYLSMHAKPDVVLLDMMMPRINGPTFVKEVRANPALRGLSIFALSGTARDEIEDSYGIIGVDRWFQKPFSPKNLVAEIAQHLTNKVLVA